MMNHEPCVICETVSSWSWTDTHGIAQCCMCGTPYVIYHYEGEGSDKKRVDKPPKCHLLDWAIPLCREYWNNTQQIMPSGCSFLPRAQELATPEQAATFYEWFEAKASELEPANAD